MHDGFGFLQPKDLSCFVWVFYTNIKKVYNCISYAINKIQIHNIKISKNVYFWYINKILITKHRQNPF